MNKSILIIKNWRKRFRSKPMFHEEMVNGVPLRNRRQDKAGGRSKIPQTLARFQSIAITIGMQCAYE
jgi:hypothetical protein